MPSVSRPVVDRFRRLAGHVGHQRFDLSGDGRDVWDRLDLCHVSAS